MPTLMSEGLIINVDRVLTINALYTQKIKRVAIFCYKDD